jgi:type I restriction enzyme R subunit
MANRPVIPIEIQREVLFQARHRCAVCCEPVSLEKAHIIPWGKSKDHSEENLIVLCANCHTRSHAEKWPKSMLRKYKQRPCALERDRMPPMSPEQKLMVDFILSSYPDSMTDKERLRFVSMMAAYVGVNYEDVRVVSVKPSNSSRIRLELPRSGAEALIAGYQAQDPRLAAFLGDIALDGERLPEKTLLIGSQNKSGLLAPLGLLRIEAASPKHLEHGLITDTSEKGLENTIFNGMTGFGWIAGDSRDFDRDQALDSNQLITFIRETQEELAVGLHLGNDSPERRKFLARIRAEITSRGIIDVLRRGVNHGKYEATLFYGTPSPGNDKAAALFSLNRFSITRQLRYSRDETRRALESLPVYQRPARGDI